MEINKDLQKRVLYFHPELFHDALKTYQASLFHDPRIENLEYRDLHGRILYTVIPHPILRGVEKTASPGTFYVATREEADALVRDSMVEFGYETANAAKTDEPQLERHATAA